MGLTLYPGNLTKSAIIRQKCFLFHSAISETRILLACSWTVGAAKG